VSSQGEELNSPGAGSIQPDADIGEPIADGQADRAESPRVTTERGGAEETSGSSDEPAPLTGLPSALGSPSSNSASDGPDRPHASGAMESEPLEELHWPTSVQPLPALPEGTALGEEGQDRILRHIGTRGRINFYEATCRSADGSEVDTELREGPLDDSGLARESEILAHIRYGMLPTWLASFDHEGRRYLVLKRTVERRTLEDALGNGMRPSEAVSIVIQLAQALRHLHQGGWALVGMTPSDVVLSEPLRIMDVSAAVRIGEVPLHPLHVPGFSAPELAHQAQVTSRADVYTLGAILYRAWSGMPVSESGPELASLPSAVMQPGGPQLLALALAPVEERVDLEEFYQRLLGYKQWLARPALALEIASGTSVGLNPTRTVNEDSCGYITWSVANAEGVHQRALLCVADGMGGMEAGEVASRAALRTILHGAFELGAQEGTQSPPLDPVALIRRAAPAVYAAGEGRSLGTTATCVFVDDATLTLGHVGDTRSYLMRSGHLVHLTNDHSLVAAMVASGVLTESEAHGHPDSNQVLRSLGSQRELPDRYVDDLSAAYGEASLRLQLGDWVLLCSDGVWGQVTDGEMETILGEALDCQSVAQALINRALRAGAPDNASVVIARCIEMVAR